MASMCNQCSTGFHPAEHHQGCQCSCNIPDEDRGKLGLVEGYVNVPKPFEGTEEEYLANVKTHRFAPPEGRCIRCDSRFLSRSAAYPCGEEEPRVLIKQGTAESRITMLEQRITATIGPVVFDKGDTQ